VLKFENKKIRRQKVKPRFVIIALFVSVELQTVFYVVQVVGMSVIGVFVCTVV
jgi:hypothetical protein